MTERPDADIAWIRTEISQGRPVHLMRAVCKIAVSRQAILGQVQRVMLAVKERDNALRSNLTPEQVREAVAKPVSPDLSQEQKPALLDTIRQSSRE